MNEEVFREDHSIRLQVVKDANNINEFAKEWDDLFKPQPSS
jgi:hypothetical protein